MKKLLISTLAILMLPAYADYRTVNVSINNHTQNHYYCYANTGMNINIGNWSGNWHLLNPGATQLKGTQVSYQGENFAQIALVCMPKPQSMISNQKFISLFASVPANISPHANCYSLDKHVSCVPSINQNQVTFNIS